MVLTRGHLAVDEGIEVCGGGSGDELAGLALEG